MWKQLAATESANGYKRIHRRHRRFRPDRTQHPIDEPRVLAQQTAGVGISEERLLQSVPLARQFSAPECNTRAGDKRRLAYRRIGGRGLGNVAHRQWG